ncbi:hypothetical protein MPER_13153 [Moniliophthora perniciosa FA553]|nr:hypothetical protein MPER_13153 [Moniliophthora perniciosa FA553]
MFFGKKPDVSYFQTFGCATYVYIPEEKRKNKLAPKAEKMTFIGYESGTKGYIFMRSDNTIFIGVKGFFLESMFPRKKSSEQLEIVPEHIPDFDLRDDFVPSRRLPLIPEDSSDDNSDDDFPSDHDVNKEEPPLHYPSPGACAPSPPCPNPFSYRPEDVEEWQHINPGSR